MRTQSLLSPSCRMERRLAIAWTGFLALATARVMSATEITVAQLKDLRTEPRKIVYSMTDQFLTGLGYLHGKATIIASRPSAEPVQPQGERVR